MNESKKDTKIGDFQQLKVDNSREKAVNHPFTVFKGLRLEKRSGVASRENGKSQFTRQN